VKDIVHNSYDAFIVQTIINMGKNLGHCVIAEGVEMQQQMTLLQNMGCHCFQGYLFSRPLPLHAFETNLLSGMRTMPTPSHVPQAQAMPRKA